MTFRQSIPLALALLLVGCTVATDPASVGPEGTFPPQGRPTVIAVIDSGVNPYHDAFRSTLSMEAVPSRSLSLSDTGTYAERVRTDAGVWASIQPGELVHFQGTRLYAVSLTEDTPTRVLDDDGHGTRVASVVAMTDPGSIIVVVEAHTVLCVEECYYHPSVPRAMEWAASQDWIDIISISAGEPVGKPHVAQAEPEVAEFAAASREAARSGKLVVASAGNVPGPTLGGGFNGPPWMICVGGAEEANRGESATAAKRVDVVSNMTMLSADFQDVSTMSYAGGTSFAAPIVAATLAGALTDVRNALGTEPPVGEPILARGTYDGRPMEIRAEHLRDALNVSASRWGPTDWDPRANPSNDTLRYLLYPTAPIVGGPSQTGWGHVDASLVSEIAAGALGALPSSPPGAEYELWMAQYQDSRERAWP